MDNSASLNIPTYDKKPWYGNYLIALIVAIPFVIVSLLNLRMVISSEEFFSIRIIASISMISSFILAMVIFPLAPYRWAGIKSRMRAAYDLTRRQGIPQPWYVHWGATSLIALSFLLLSFLSEHVWLTSANSCLGDNCILERGLIGIVAGFIAEISALAALIAFPIIPTLTRTLGWHLPLPPQKENII